MEERMKSVDRDFDEYGNCNINRWILYGLLFVGFLVILAKAWTEIHVNGLSFHTVFQAIMLPLVFLFPFVVSLQFSRYMRNVLKEDLLSERVAKNCEFWIRNQMLIVYLAIMFIASRN
jgi:flagellar biosynthesis protein FliQ